MNFCYKAKESIDKEDMTPLEVAMKHDNKHLLIEDKKIHNTVFSEQKG